MNSIKIYNVGFNWDNAVGGNEERVFPSAPIAKSGSLNVEYPPFQQGAEISLMPKNAEGMDLEQINGHKRVREKRINRIVEQSNGKLSLIAPEDMPLTKTEVQGLQDQIAELQVQLAAKEEAVVEPLVAEEVIEAAVEEALESLDDIPPTKPVQRSTRKRRQARSGANKPIEEGE